MKITSPNTASVQMPSQKDVINNKIPAVSQQNNGRITNSLNYLAALGKSNINFGKRQMFESSDKVTVTSLPNGLRKEVTDKQTSKITKIINPEGKLTKIIWQDANGSSKKIVDMNDDGMRLTTISSTYGKHGMLENKVVKHPLQPWTGSYKLLRIPDSPHLNNMIYLLGGKEEDADEIITIKNTYDCDGNKVETLRKKITPQGCETTIYLNANHPPAYLGSSKEEAEETYKIFKNVLAKNQIDHTSPKIIWLKN